MWLFVLLYGISRIQTARTDSDDVLSPQQITDIRAKMLAEHNKYRLTHQVDPLELDDTLNHIAEEWALALSKNETYAHLRYGENHWSKAGGKLADLMTTPDENPVKYWYDQIKDYSGGYISKPELKTDGFTQIVWKSTKKLGCGFKRSTDTRFVVCAYEPRGNAHDSKRGEIQSSYHANVMAPEGQSWPATDGAFSFWWLLLFVIVCVGVVGGWEFYRRRQLPPLTPRRRSTRTSKRSSRYSKRQPKRPASQSAPRFPPPKSAVQAATQPVTQSSRK